MINISSFTNTDCQLGAFVNLDKLRQPMKIAYLDRYRLLTFMPEPYAIPVHVKETVNQFSNINTGNHVPYQYTNMPSTAQKIMNQLLKMRKLFEFISEPKNQKNMRTYEQILADSNNQMAMNINKNAINDVANGRAVPFYAVYLDALAKPEPKQPIKTEKLTPKTLYRSISERLAAKVQRQPKTATKTKASRETIDLYKKQNKGKITLEEYHILRKKEGLQGKISKKLPHLKLSFVDYLMLFLQSR